MKKFTKLLGIVLIIALVMSMGITAAFAAAPTTGSVTVNPNNKGQTYTLYKLFDAHITFTENTTGDETTYTRAAITYSLPTGKTLDTTGSQWFEVNSNGFVEAKDTLTEAVMKSTEFITWAKSFGTANETTKTASKDNDPAVKWDNLGFGYYFVDSTLGAFVAVNSNDPDVTVADKNNPPKLDKKIKSVKDSANETSGSIFDATATEEIQFEGDGSNEHAIAQIGDTITYTIEVTAKPGAENYVVTDTLDAGLTPPAATAITVKAGDTDLKTQETKAGTKDAVVAVNGQVFTVTFSNDYLNTLTADTVITIEYTATLNSSAIVAVNPNNNTARLEWGHKPTKDYTEDQSKVWTAKVDVYKQIGDDSTKPLAGAGFKLKKGDLYYKFADGVVTWVAEAQADEFLTQANGKFAEGTAFKGLANGSYTLIESTVPAGYNKLDDTTVTISGSNTELSNLSQTKQVQNNAGTVLPSTGGIGTTIFYVVGSILVVAAGVLLVTKKRMSREG